MNENKWWNVMVNNSYNFLLGKLDIGLLTRFGSVSSEDIKLLNKIVTSDQ